MKEKETFSSRH